MHAIQRAHRVPLSAAAVDGPVLLAVSACVLVLSGLFAMLLGATGRFLPHDERFLGMTAAELCSLHGCRIVHFMIHDRVSFGGALVAVGVVYLWMVASPLRRGEVWAWWLFVLTGAVGFGSFLAFLGYGYLDAWHAAATVGLLAVFLLGLARSRGVVARQGVRSLLRPAAGWPGLGRVCLLAAAAGLVAGGGVILTVGSTCVFVPQDLTYMGLSVEEIRSLNPRLMPLIAHDRAGFGGAVCCCGLALFFCVWCGRPSRGLWATLAAAGAVGFGAAIGVHPAVGYVDALHLAPAVLGALVYFAGLGLCYPPLTAAASPARNCVQNGRSISSGYRQKA